MIKSFTTQYQRQLFTFMGLIALWVFAVLPLPVQAQAEPEKDILETAIEAKDFRVLVALLKAAELDETLQGDGPFTIFAPTDTAFTAIPLPKIRELRNDPKGDLTTILLSHGVEGKISAVDIVDLVGEHVTNLNGLDLILTEENGVVKVNGASIISTDIEASNGVIHVIDTVLIPRALAKAWSSADSGAAAEKSEMSASDEGPNDEDAASEEAKAEEDSADESGNKEESDGSSDSDEAHSGEAGSDETHSGDADSDEADSDEAGSDEAGSDEAGSDEAGSDDESDDASNMADDDAVADADVGENEEANASDADEPGSEEVDSNESDANDEADADESSNEAGDASDSSDEMAEAGDASAAPNPAPAQDLIDTATSSGNFTALVAALYTADLVNTLKGEGPFTLFAPADSVFSALPAGGIQELLDLPKEELAAKLLFHVVPGEFTAEDIVGLVNSDVETANGSLLPIRADEIGIRVGNATMVATNIRTMNGIIHIIDTIMDESVAIAASAAQSNEISDAQAAATEPIAAPAASTRTADLIDTAVAAGNFNTLVAALRAAGLDETLKAGGSFTIFAPTDEAFAVLPEGTVDALLADPSGALTDLLLLHTVEGLLPADYIASIGGSPLSTVNGALLMISVTDSGGVLINDAQVIATDIAAMNGLIHVIDRVLIAAPSSSTAAPAPVAEPLTAPVAEPVAVPTAPAASTESATPLEAPTVPPAPTAAQIIEPTVVETVEPEETEEEFSCLLYYVVDPGNTLSQIADLYASTVSLLMRANGISDPDDLKSGQILCIVR